MVPVALDEVDAEGSGEHRANEALPRAGDAHHDVDPCVHAIGARMAASRPDARGSRALQSRHTSVETSNYFRQDAAILRLGAAEEGILRRRMIHRDGSFRDAVYFSILDDEWPDAKRRLEERLEARDFDPSR
jgi:hypothetical protein